MNAYLFVFQFALALYIVGFEYWVRREIVPTDYGRFLGLIVVGLIITSATSLYLKSRRIWGTPVLAFWPSLFMSLRSWFFFIGLGVLIVANFWRYHDQPATPELSIFLAGMLLSQGIVVWRRLQRDLDQWQRFSLQMVIALAGALVFAGIFHPNWSGATQVFQYRGAIRWSGPVKDPNLFGLLMAEGLVLTLALALFLAKTLTHSPDPPLGWIKGIPFRAQIIVAEGLLVSGLVVCAIALIKSYSRGAWLSTLAGIAYFFLFRPEERLQLAGKPVSGSPVGIVRLGARVARFFRRNRTPLILMATALLVCGCCFFSNSQVRIIRRVFSPVNANDFSWRNRVIAYEGSLQIMADNPWLGVGWGRPQILYDQYYRPSRITEGYAIFLNDYFTLGMILGLPALFCFAGLVWPALKSSSLRAARQPDAGQEKENPELSRRKERGESIQTATRAGMVVLLTGFWFDRGFFTVPLGFLFWLLLELRNEPGMQTTGQKFRARADQIPGYFNFLKISCVNRRGFWLLALLVAAFAGAMYWSRGLDPYLRIRFQLYSRDGKLAEGMAVMPRPAGRYPVAVYIYGADSSLLTCGIQLRGIADAGLCAVGIEYSKDDPKVFGEQMIALREFLRSQPWASTNVAWIGSGSGARQALDFASTHAGMGPELLVEIEGGSTSDLNGNSGPGCPVLLVSSKKDSLFLPEDCNKLLEWLLSCGISARIYTVPGTSHSPEVDAPAVLRTICEYCVDQLPPPDYLTPLKLALPEPEARRFNRALQYAGQKNKIWQKLTCVRGSARLQAVHEIAQSTQNDFVQSVFQEPRLGKDRNRLRYGLLMALLGVGWFCFRDRRRKIARNNSRHVSNDTSSVGRMIRIIASLLAMAAVLIVTVRLALPAFKISASTLPLAQRFYRSFDQADLDSLARNTEATRISVGVFFDNLELAILQKDQFYTNLEPRIFQQYVLCSRLDARDSGWNWRRPLWENFQPRIRHEHDPTAGASIVVNYLRERMGIDPLAASLPDVEHIWVEQRSDEEGFQRIYVATLRSVGIAARLNEAKQAELWTGSGWQLAPLPIVSWIPRRSS